MRFFPTQLALILAPALAGACMGTQGGGRGDDTTTQDTTPCATVQEMDGDIVIRNDSQVVPAYNGCYDLMGTLRVQGPVTSLAGLGRIQSVTDLEILGTQLGAIDTPDPITIYDGGLDLEENPALSDLSNLQFDNLSHVTITNNDGLLDLGDIDLSLDKVYGDTGDAGERDGSVTISNNANLTSIKLTRLKEIDGAITIDSNPKLTLVDFSGLTQFGTSVALPLPWSEDITITNNPKLTTIKGFSQLTGLPGALVIDNNATLASVAGFDAVTTINGNLELKDDPLLADFMTSGMLGLVGKSVTIDNTGFVTITAFSTELDVIPLNLAITNNTKLTGVGRLAHLRDAGNGYLRNGSINQALTITGNSELPYCAAREVQKCTTILGSVSISSNRENSGNCTSWCQ
ncbi:MAG TPA: hypothetical protein VGM88_23790 [Kofleriaceae bacterium]|jgi:hypothetical protein